MASGSGLSLHSGQQQADSDKTVQTAKSSGKLRQVKSLARIREPKRVFSRSTAVPAYRQFERYSGPLPATTHDPDIYAVDSILDEQPARINPLPASTRQIDPPRMQRRVIEVRVSSKEDMLADQLQSSRKEPPGNVPNRLSQSSKLPRPHARRVEKSRKRKMLKKNRDDPNERTQNSTQADELGFETGDQIQLQREADHAEVSPLNREDAALGKILSDDTGHAVSVDAIHRSPRNRIPAGAERRGKLGRGRSQDSAAPGKLASSVQSQQALPRNILPGQPEDDEDKGNRSEPALDHDSGQDVDVGAENLRDSETQFDTGTQRDDQVQSESHEEHGEEASESNIAHSASSREQLEEGDEGDEDDEVEEVDKSEDVEQPDQPEDGEEDDGDSSEQLDELDGSEHSDRDSDLDTWLFGEIDNVAKAWKALRGLNPRMSTRNEPVKELRDLCAGVEKAWNTLSNDLTTGLSGDAMPTEFARIEQIVVELCNPNRDNQTDPETISAIYNIVLPSLASLYMNGMAQFDRLNEHLGLEHASTIAYLRIVRYLVELALRMGKGLYGKYKSKPAQIESRKIHKKHTMVLRGVLKTVEYNLQKHDTAKADEIARLRKDEESRRQVEEERQEEARTADIRRQEQHSRAAAREQEDERKQREDERERQIDARRNQWRRLHSVRRFYEYRTIGFSHRERVAKKRHLEVVDPRDVHETDFNGDLFQRDGSLATRVGPPFAMIEQARSVEWSEKQWTTLYRGLEAWAGPEVFERIFEKHCGFGQELNEFNVTQIVVKAAELKAWLLDWHKSRAEPWIHQIPDWTKPFALGKENEGVDSDEGD